MGGHLGEDAPRDQGGKGPDVSVAHGDDLATYAAQGLLLKSDSIVKTLGYGASDFPAGVFNAGNYKGAQYAVPWSITPLGLYVNTDGAQEGRHRPGGAIPTDKAGYLKALDALKAAGVQGEWVDGYVFTGTFEFESLIWQWAASCSTRTSPQATFNSDAGVQGAHLDDRPRSRTATARRTSPRTATSTPSSPARPPSTGTASGRPPTPRFDEARAGRPPRSRRSAPRRPSGPARPTGSSRPTRGRTRTRRPRRRRSSSG